MATPSTCCLNTRCGVLFLTFSYYQQEPGSGSNRFKATIKSTPLGLVATSTICLSFKARDHTSGFPCLMPCAVRLALFGSTAVGTRSSPVTAFRKQVLDANVDACAKLFEFVANSSGSDQSLLDAHAILVFLATNSKSGAKLATTIDFDAFVHNAVLNGSGDVSDSAVSCMLQLASSRPNLKATIISTATQCISACSETLVSDGNQANLFKLLTQLYSPSYRRIFLVRIAVGLNH